MKKYRIGIIGYGGFGKFLHHWLDKLENVEITAVTDSGSHFQSSENFKSYTDWHDLVNDAEVDIVCIVTPPNLHAEMACAAMKSGKHVLLEKPVAITLESAEKLLEVQKETGMVITVDHMIRYNPIIQQLKQLGQSGAFGKLRHVVVNNYAQDTALPNEHWFWNEAISGGIMVEHGVHFFDIVHALSNQQYKEVYGCSHQRNELQRDRMAAMVLYDDGLIGDYYHAFSGPGFFEQTTIHLAYDLARVEIEGWMPLKGTLKALVNDQIKEQLQNIPGWEVTENNSMDALRDVSRPEGWGDSDSTDSTGNQQIHAGGVDYDVTEMISGNFEIHQTKGEVYGKCVQDILSDMIRKIENNQHKLNITIEDAVEALKIALLASK